LPLAVLQRIIEETLSLDMAMLGVFNRVSKTFRELAKPFHPSVYINESRKWLALLFLMSFELRSRE